MQTPLPRKAKAVLGKHLRGLPLWGRYLDPLTDLDHRTFTGFLKILFARAAVRKLTFMAHFRRHRGHLSTHQSQCQA